MSSEQHFFCSVCACRSTEFGFVMRVARLGIRFVCFASHRLKKKEQNAPSVLSTHTYAYSHSHTYARVHQLHRNMFSYVRLYAITLDGEWTTNAIGFFFHFISLLSFVRCRWEAQSKKIHRVDVLTCIKLHTCYLFILLTVWDSAHSISTSWNWRFNRFLLRKSYLSYVQSLKIKLLANGTN